MSVRVRSLCIRACAAALLAVLSNHAFAQATSTNTGWVTFHNDFYWTDTAGNRILTRSG
jgi:hypothetical protein